MSSCGHTIAEIQQCLKNAGLYNGPTDGTSNIDYANALIAYLKSNGVSENDLLVAPGSAPAQKVCDAINKLCPPPAIAINDPVAVSTSSSSKSWVLPVVIGGGILVVVGLWVMASKSSKYSKNHEWQQKWPPMTKSEERAEYIKFAMKPPYSFTRKEAEGAWREFSRGLDRSEESVYGKPRKK